MFNKEIVFTKNVDKDEMKKKYLFQQEFLSGKRFTKSIKIETPMKFNHLLNMTKKYIRDEEMLDVNRVVQSGNEKLKQKVQQE